MIETHPKIAQAGGVQWSPAMRDSAERETRKYNESLRRGRRLPAVLKEVQKISDMQRVHIFNVGPWTDNAMLGSWGSWLIPACPKGEKYVHVATLPGIYNEPQPEDGKFTIDQVSGAYIAQCILGQGPDLRNVPLSESRQPHGVFIGSVVGPNGITPLDSEIEAANFALDAYLDELIAEANRAHELGGKESELVISSKHRLAASVKGRVDLKWMNKQVSERLIPCVKCGTMRNPQYPVCATCRFDHEMVAAQVAGPVAPPLSPTAGKRA